MGYFLFCFQNYFQATQNPKWYLGALNELNYPKERKKNQFRGEFSCIHLQ